MTNAPSFRRTLDRSPGQAPESRKVSPIRILGFLLTSWLPQSHCLIFHVVNVKVVYLTQVHGKGRITSEI